MSELVIDVAATHAPAGDFDYWWNAPGAWVEPPNERRSGWSGVLRVRHHGRIVYVKRQTNHLCRSLQHPLGWPTASREWTNLERLRRLGVCAPVPLFHGARRTALGVEAVLATAELTGFSPLDAQRHVPSEQRRRLASELGAMLARLHRARLQHGCLYDKHVMVRWHADRPELALLDLEKMRPRLRALAAARHDLDQLRRHQDIWSAAEWRLLEAQHATAFRAG